MAEEPEQGADLQRLRDAVREAVISGHDLQASVRDLMLATFSSSGISPGRIQEVIRATLEGVEAGALVHGGAAGESARRAVAGIEEALMQAAEASSLAIREAAGHASDFARTDLRRAVDELASLEKLFLDTLADTAQAGSAVAKVTFSDIQRHLRYSGSALGEQLAIHVSSLRELLSRSGQERLQSGAQAAGKAAGQLGKFAGAILAGIGKGLADAGTAPAGRRKGDGDGEGDS